MAKKSSFQKPKRTENKIIPFKPARGEHMIVPHSRSSIDHEDIKAVTDVLASGHISQGEKVREFENKLARFVGTKYGIAVSSGTSAIHLALKSQNVGAGDEVIIPSYVCASPFMATLHAGATPKIVDVDTSDFNICATTVKKEITQKTKLIIVPHMFGAPAEIDELLDTGIPIIEDCAQSLGAEYKKQKTGSLGTLAVCSFYATKIITAGEGGMVLTNDDEAYEKIIETREYDKKSLNVIRYNYKMTDIQAALGLSQLKKLPNFIDRRREIATIYNKRFSECTVTLPSIHSHKKSVFYRYVVLVDRLNHVQSAAKKKGIICEKPVWRPLHKNLAYKECPNSDYIYDHALSIPLYPSLTEEEIEKVVRTLRVFFAETK
jgi:dTDP-4-amino-4,6-dideoxygalactose transaminase